MPIESSPIRDVEPDPETQTLEIGFNNGTLSRFTTTSGFARRAGAEITTSKGWQGCRI
jgi:hypothetical protein